MVTLSDNENANTAYHCAAVMASNYLVSLSSAAVMLGELAGLDRNTCIEMLQPLQRGALDAIHQEGIDNALTGPITRGDVDTVSAHLELINSQLPQLRSLYVEAGLFTLSIARMQRGDNMEFDAIESVLKKGQSGFLNEDIKE
jgi:predicted short-subunit dehydrogenase-like oxidoreductase (DUF2520 family)